LTHHRLSNCTHGGVSNIFYFQWLWLNGNSGTAPVACTFSGWRNAMYLSELFENQNYLNLMYFMVDREIFVFFKFRKNYKYKLCSLFSSEGNRSD
jgi:hypothetical protein